MRWLVVPFLIFFACPGMAQQWDRYVNPRFGTVMSIPPGYIVEMESADADGRLYVSPNRDESLLVWGSHLIDQTLQEHFKSLITDDKSLGWSISYKAKGDGWRVYSGSKEHRIIYAKILASCEGRQAQHFKFEYAESKKLEFDELVTTLSNSLKSRKGIDCP